MYTFGWSACEGSNLKLVRGALHRSNAKELQKFTSCQTTEDLCCRGEVASWPCDWHECPLFVSKGHWYYYNDLALVGIREANVDLCFLPN